MGVIYRGAKQVLCWIGPDDEEIRHMCFRFVEEAAEQNAERWDTEISAVDALYKLELPAADNVVD
jgi:hypothetical protein